MGFFRRLGKKIGKGFARFMAGRYGVDKLNMAILSLGVVVCLIAMFVRLAFLDMLLTLLSYGLMFWAIFRVFSRNTYKRSRENRRYLNFLQRLKDREHKYFVCPRCHQTVRVPRGKGKIAITCPKCREKFVRKS